MHQVDTKYQPNEDPKILQDMGLAEVRSLDLDRLIGDGILHSKMWLVDNIHVYLGSANMDWRSLTQVLMSTFPLLSRHAFRSFSVVKGWDEKQKLVVCLCFTHEFTVL